MITVTEIVGQYGNGQTRWLDASYASISPHMKGKPIDTLKDERQSWLNKWKRLQTGRLYPRNYTVQR